MKRLTRSFIKIIKMSRLRFFYTSSLLVFSLVSCSVEKLNLSPVNDAVVDAKLNAVPYTQRKGLILYSSEITGLISSFPKLRNDAVNSEVGNLKYHLKDYIGAMEAYNINGMNSAQRKFEKSYKKIQKLRTYLNSEDDQVLNRYLVRIKTNMTLLESNFPKDSLNIPIK